MVTSFYTLLSKKVVKINIINIDIDMYEKMLIKHILYKRNTV